MKKNFKSMFALMLALTLILTACGSGGKDSTPVEGTDGNGSTTGEGVSLTVQAEADWMEYYEAAIERVKEDYPEADIELVEMGAFDHLDIIDNTDASNEDVADVFALPADRLVGLSENQVLAGIDSMSISEKLGGWDDFDSGIGGNFKIDDEYLAFPYNIETLINFVNVRNAEEKGLDSTMVFDLNDVADEDTILFPLFDAWYGVSVTNAAGIELLGQEEDGTLFSDLTMEWNELDAEKQAAIETIYKYWELNNNAGTPLFDPDAGWGYIDTEFAEGNGGVIRLGGPWDTASIAEQAGEGNLEIYPIDHLAINGQPFAHWKGGWGLGINSRIEEDLPKMEVAEAVIAEIVNPEYAVDLFKATGKILENVPKEDYENSELSDLDKTVISAVIDSYEDAPARPLFKEWGNVWDTWKNAVLSWNSVKPASAEEAYNELKASFESMMLNF